MEYREPYQYKEGPRTRIRGQVKFTSGNHYIGRNQACRVELVPCLGYTSVAGEPRYITVPPSALWYAWVVQAGYYWRIYEPIAPQDVHKYIDTTAFQWRKCKTNALWLDHPLEPYERYPANAPYAFPVDYKRETDEYIHQEFGFVYFIKADGMNRVRIGWTTDATRRTSELVRGSPSTLQYMAILPGTREDETDLQERFHDFREHHDWFELTNEVRQYIDWAQKYWRKLGERPFKYIPDSQLPIGEQGVIIRPN